MKREQIELVLVAGDIFDSSVSASGAIALYNQAVTALCNQLEVPVVIIAGNHDGAVRLTSCSEILKKSGLYLYGKVTLCPQPVEVGDVCVYPIPFFNIEEIRQQLQEENISTYQEAMEAVTESIRKEMDPAKTNVALAHCFCQRRARFLTVTRRRWWEWPRRFLQRYFGDLTMWRWDTCTGRKKWGKRYITAALH